MSTAQSNAPVLEKVMEEILISALQVGYKAAKEGVKAPLFNVEGEVIDDTIMKGRMYTLLMRNIDTPNKRGSWTH